MNRNLYRRMLQGNGGAQWSTLEGLYFRAAFGENKVTTVDAGIGAGDIIYRVEEPSRLYLVTETHTGPIHDTHCLQFVHLKTNVVRSNNGPSDNFGIPVRDTETLLYQDVPLYVGPGHLISVTPHRGGTTERLQHKVILPGKYPLKVTDRLELTNGTVMRVLAKLLSSVGLGCYHVVVDHP